MLRNTILSILPTTMPCTLSLKHQLSDIRQDGQPNALVFSQPGPRPRSNYKQVRARTRANCMAVPQPRAAHYVFACRLNIDKAARSVVDV